MRDTVEEEEEMEYGNALGYQERPTKDEKETSQEEISRLGMILKHRATLARRHLRQEETPPETYKENLDLRSVQFIDVTLKDFGVMKSLKKE